MYQTFLKRKCFTLIKKTTTAVFQNRDVAGIAKNSTAKTTYEYNDKDFPVKVITDNSAYEYKYE